MAVKYVFVTGGVVSSLGKGITAASLGRLLKSRGYKVINKKFDPYINVDSGNLKPSQHGEIFVTADGAECDLDIGHYERFTDENLTVGSNFTAGKIYWNVISKERMGDYTGGTVQVIPHITNEIKEHIYNASTTSADIVICEIGGTVGDIESLPFIEAARQVKWERPQDCLIIHVTLVPYVKSAGEIKTKPTQHSVKELRAIGIQPDIIVCRCERPLGESVRKKIALFCNVDYECVVENLDMEFLYEAALSLEKEGLGRLTCEKLGLEAREAQLSEWEDMVRVAKSFDKKVKIALIGKYAKLHDAYLSVSEAALHAGLGLGTEVEMLWLNCSDIDTDEKAKARLCDVHGIIMPGGLDEDGMVEKFRAIRYARQNRIPFLGISSGMHIAAQEFANNVVGSDAQVLRMLDIPVGENGKPPRRLGTAKVDILPGTKLAELYGAASAEERHRHILALNDDAFEALEAQGLIKSAMCEKDGIIEAIELRGHPFFIGVQYDPQFASRPNRPHALFTGLVKAALATADREKQLMIEM